MLRYNLCCGGLPNGDLCEKCGSKCLPTRDYKPCAVFVELGELACATDILGVVGQDNSYPVIEPGAGHAVFATQMLKPLSVLTVDPDPGSFNPENYKFWGQEPAAKTVSALLKKRKYASLSRNCHLLMVWPSTNAGTTATVLDWDYDAIKKLMPRTISIAFDATGSSGGDHLRYFLRTCGAPVYLDSDSDTDTTATNPKPMSLLTQSKIAKVAKKYRILIYRARGMVLRRLDAFSRQISLVNKMLGHPGSENVRAFIVLARKDIDVFKSEKTIWDISFSPDFPAKWIPTYDPLLG